MTGRRGSDGNGGGFIIAHFTDKNNIRVLPQKGAQRYTESEADGYAKVGLADTVQVVFHRVFSRMYVDFFFIKLTLNRIKGRCFAASCRAGDQKHAKRIPD